MARICSAFDLELVVENSIDFLSNGIRVCCCQCNEMIHFPITSPSNLPTKTILFGCFYKDLKDTV